MGLIEVTYYQAGCDACGRNMTEDSEYSAWAQDFAALDAVEDCGGYLITRGKGNPETVICPGCRREFETTCTEEEREMLDDQNTGMEAVITTWAASQLRMAKGVQLMPSHRSKPTELMVALATIPGTNGHRSDGWMASDEVRARLEMFGFDCSSQQLVAMLKYMSAVDAPWIERRPSPWNARWFEYRLTVWGRNDITNKLPLIDLRAPWLEVARV